MSDKLRLRSEHHEIVEYETADDNIRESDREANEITLKMTCDCRANEKTCNLRSQCTRACESDDVKDLVKV